MGGRGRRDVSLCWAPRTFLPCEAVPGRQSGSAEAARGPRFGPGFSTVRWLGAQSCGVYRGWCGVTAVVALSPSRWPREPSEESEQVPLSPTTPVSPQRAEDYGPVEVISHWHPNITINIVDDHTPWVKGSVPPPLDQCETPAPRAPPQAFSLSPGSLSTQPPHPAPALLRYSPSLLAPPW